MTAGCDAAHAPVTQKNFRSADRQNAAKNFAANFSRQAGLRLLPLKDGRYLKKDGRAGSDVVRTGVPTAGWNRRYDAPAVHVRAR